MCQVEGTPPQVPLCVRDDKAWGGLGCRPVTRVTMVRPACAPRYAAMKHPRYSGVSGSIGKGIGIGVDEVGYGDLGGLCRVPVI